MRRSLWASRGRPRPSELHGLSAPALRLLPEARLAAPALPSSSSHFAFIPYSIAAAHAPRLCPVRLERRPGGGGGRGGRSGRPPAVPPQLTHRGWVGGWGGGWGGVGWGGVGWGGVGGGLGWGPPSAFRLALLAGRVLRWSLRDSSSSLPETVPLPHLNSPPTHAPAPAPAPPVMCRRGAGAGAGGGRPPQPHPQPRRPAAVRRDRPGVQRAARADHGRCVCVRALV